MAEIWGRDWDDPDGSLTHSLEIIDALIAEGEEYWKQGGDS